MHFFVTLIACVSVRLISSFFLSPSLQYIQLDCCSNNIFDQTEPTARPVADSVIIPTTPSPIQTARPVADSVIIPTTPSPIQTVPPTSSPTQGFRIIGGIDDTRATAGEVISTGTVVEEEESRSQFTNQLVGGESSSTMKKVHLGVGLSFFFLYATL
jgi:hypothetical protein